MCRVAEVPAREWAGLVMDTADDGRSLYGDMTVAWKFYGDRQSGIMIIVRLGWQRWNAFALSRVTGEQL
ncbi:hypothetical protein ACQ4M4_20220 [Leptolyngbya sp. AN02str]|uniref:hypothetical protein n=1 Tax=Leptolyngbya sp. AN02str TaxID=3423363 RepID=UPI003D3231F4